jgi:vancomycin resistance protein YoaR
MTWDSHEPSNQAKPSASHPQGWEGPGWWDESGTPARKTASAVRSAPAGQSVRGTATTLPTSNGSGNGSNGSGNGSNGSAATDKVTVAAARRARSRTASKPHSGMSMATVRFVVGFTIGVFGALILASAAVLGLSQAYDGKIMPGVHAGTVDLSGLTRDEAVSAIDSAYASLGQGQVTITTPTGTGTITYQEAGRAPDSAAMADAALSVGHGDNPVTSVTSAIRTFAGGVQIPVIVKLDPLALETKLHQITGSTQDPPTDASVSVSGTDFTVVPGTPGRGIDENTIATGLIDQLASADAPSQIQVGGKFVTVQPNVTDADAQAAIDSANKMSADLTLAYAGKTWTIDAATIRSWIIFGNRTDGTYGPVINPALVLTYVGTLTKDVNVAAVEPNIVYKSGQPNGVTQGKPGLTLDVDGTAQAIEAYLDNLGSGGENASTDVALVVDVTQPTLADNPQLTGFVIIGSWDVVYLPGESNGNGVNINLPATILNGQVVAPGAEFNFLGRVGTISLATGWKMGGVILNGASNHTGAVGGGICSMSTTMFNAAARAGLQIDERHAHFYYIDRYPVGLDATVYSNGSTTWNLRWTNDTPYPIVIRSWTAGTSSKRRIYVQLWSLPNGRTTTFSPNPPVKTSIVKATDTTEYVAALPPGEKSPYRFEYPTNGFNTVVTRTVKDASGAVIHTDTWYSHYGVVNGLLAYKGTPPPSKTPTPTPGPATPTPTKPPATPTPPPTPPPSDTPTPAPAGNALLPLTLLPLLAALVPISRRRRLLRK